MDEVTPLYTPPTAPPTANGTLSQQAGGTLAAATYYVKSTWTAPTGETTPSPETSLAVAANNVLVVQPPSGQAPYATGWNVYVSTTTGTETKQNTLPIAMGLAWTEPTTGLVAGPAPPATNTTGTIAQGTAADQIFASQHPNSIALIRAVKPRALAYASHHALAIADIPNNPEANPYTASHPAYQPLPAEAVTVTVTNKEGAVIAARQVERKNHAKNQSQRAGQK